MIFLFFLKLSWSPDDWYRLQVIIIKSTGNMFSPIEGKKIWFYWMYWHFIRIPSLWPLTETKLNLIERLIGTDTASVELFSTYSPPEFRHLSYCGTNFCILYHKSLPFGIGTTVTFISASLSFWKCWPDRNFLRWKLLGVGWMMIKHLPAGDVCE